MRQLASSFSTALLILLLSACSTSLSEAKRGEQLREAGDCNAAIESFSKHMQERLSLKSQNKDTSDYTENPYFYYLLIADCKKELGELSEAEKFYLLALKNKVNTAAVAERIRRLAEAYQEQDNFDKAFELLEAHRHLDPLMFDSSKDRTHKAFIRREDEKRADKQKNFDSNKPLK